MATFCRDHWREDRPPEALQETYQNMRTNPAIMAEKDWGRGTNPVPVGVTVSDVSGDDPIPRMAVLGGCQRLTDAAAGGDDEVVSNEFLLFAATIDWLRGREENIGVEATELGVYRFDAEGVNNRRMEFLPLLIVLLAIPGLGLGVWLNRRR